MKRLRAKAPLFFVEFQKLCAITAATALPCCPSGNAALRRRLYRKILLPFFSLSLYHIIWYKGEDEMENTALSISKNQRKAFFGADTATVLSLLAGIALGVAVSSGMTAETLVSTCDISDRIELMQGGNWLEVFLPSFFGTSVFLTVLYLFGYSAISQALSLAVCALRGVGLGVCMRGIYLCDGVMINLAAFLPFSIASTAVVLAQAKQSIRMSGYYFSMTLTSENRLGVKTEVSDYTVKFVVFEMLVAIFCALDCLLVRLLSNVL